MEASQEQTRVRVRYTREFMVALKDEHKTLVGGVEKLGDLHIDNVGAMNLQQLRPQSTSSRYQFSRLISPHPDDGNAVRSPTRGGHQSHSPLGGHNAGRFNAFSQAREESGRRGGDGRWDAHKSLDLGRRDGGGSVGSVGSGGGHRESSGGLSSSLPSNSSSRWVKTEGGDHNDWRSRKGSPKKSWQDGSHGSHGHNHGHLGGGLENGGGNPVWADVSVDPSQRIEMHVADVIEQERQKMKDMWRKQAEEKKRAAAAAALQEEVGDDEIEMWKVEQEREDGQNHAGGVRAALLRRKDEVLRKEDQARRNPAVHSRLDIDREKELRAQMAGMAMSSGSSNGGLEGKTLLAMLGGGPGGPGGPGMSGGPMPPIMRPGPNVPPNMMHPGMHPGMAFPPNMQNVQNMPPGMNLPPPNMRMPPGFPGVPIGQAPPGMMHPGMPMPPNMPSMPQGAPLGRPQMPMGGAPPHGMVRPGQQLNVAALFGQAPSPQNGGAPNNMGIQR